MSLSGASETSAQNLSLSEILSRRGLGAKPVETTNNQNSEPPKKLRILIVEDERIVARDLQVRLTNLGYSINGTASSKQEALTAARQNRPDLVLMDIRLNGVPEGIDAARELRSNFNLPVIYLTGHSDNATLSQARTTEPFGYILKPFENRELVAAIETAVYKHLTETRLREANARLQLAQRAGRVGVFDYNGETGELYVTPELEELRQASPGSIRSLDDLWNGQADLSEQRALHARFVDWIDSDRVDESWEHRIPMPLGQPRWVQVRAHLYRNAEGKPLRIIGTEVDITGLKEMEEALVVKDSELERSNADLQAYAYTIAHDLQEPVRTLVCGVELIERDLGGKLEASHQRLFFFVKNSADHLRRMIAGLLEYSRLGQDDETVSRADCKEALQTVTESLRVLIAETEAQIDASNLPIVAVSEQRVAQLFQNLIGNALKFRRPGVPPRVTISAERVRAYWRFTVADNGIGFDMLYADRIFGVFKRLHAREVEGTGIGLSVCKRIVERAGGAIRAESAPGEGARFLFTLPVLVEETKRLDVRNQSTGEGARSAGGAPETGPALGTVLESES
jgi:signal transduction histidine kinase